MNISEIDSAQQILLVENNLGDVRTTQEDFKELKILNNMNVVRDGADG